MTGIEHQNQTAGNGLRNGPEVGMTSGRRPAFRGIYFIGLAATAIGIGVIILLNLATPLNYLQGQLVAADQTKALHLSRQLRGLFNLAFLLLLTCPLLLLFIRSFLRPVAEYFDLLNAGRDSEDLLQKARQHVINLPFVLIPVNMGLWILLPCALHLAAYATGNLDSRTAVILAIRAIMVGFISAGIMSLWIESNARMKLIPCLFPRGRLTEVKGAARYSISRRIRLHNRLGSLIPMAILVITLMTLQWQLNSEAVAVKEYGAGVLVFCLVLFSVFFVTLSVFNKLLNRSITKPIENILAAVTRIKAGDLQTSVQVVSNDEIGVLGDATNEMIQGLRERERIQQSLDLAGEVQQNLLPKTDLKIHGLDIAGKSLYCDETGGDYYDFISIMENGRPKIGIGIGDVSGHGISSALLMATVRSALRQRSSLPGSAADIISDVNRQLVQDVEDSGHFVTLFYLIIDPLKKHLEYVRAGHDPAIFYDAPAEAFEELGGSGMALGVDKNWKVMAYTKTALEKGQIIFLGTDGVREACNLRGEAFGKQRIYDVIRNCSSLSASEILNAMMESLNRFQKGAKLEDDVTLVVIKIID
jgi:serine phosphatase RsbU (regulator of sigma subunit)